MECLRIQMESIEYDLKEGRIILYKQFIVWLGLIVLLTACGTNVLTFSGEGEHWSAKLIVSQTDKRQEEDFTLHYLGDDTESVGEFSYVVESVGSFSGNGATLNESGVLTSGGSCGGCAFTSEHTEIIVTIEWNGQTETFQLENE